MKRFLGWASVILLAGAVACWGAYRWIGSEVDAEGILREPFALIPLGWLCLLGALVGGIAYMFIRPPDSAG